MPDYRSTLDPDTSVLIVQDTGIVAMSLVTSKTLWGRTMIICEAARSDHPDGERLVGAAAAQSLDRLRHRGIRLVEFGGTAQTRALQACSPASHHTTATRWT